MADGARARFTCADARVTKMAEGWLRGAADTPPTSDIPWRRLIGRAVSKQRLNCLHAALFAERF